MWELILYVKFMSLWRLYYFFIQTGIIFGVTATCFDKCIIQHHAYIKSLLIKESYNLLLLYFIHLKFTVALGQAVSSDIRNDRDVDYNQNDLFKRSFTWGVYRKTLVTGRDAEPWLLIGGGPRTMLLVGWDGLRWSGDLPAVISSRFSCSGISSIRVGLQVSWNLRPRRKCQNIRPCCFTKTNCALWNTGRKPLE